MAPARRWDRAWGALNIFGYVARGQGDLPAARAAAEEELAIARALPDQHLAIEATRDLARLAFEQDDVVRARCLLEECLALFRKRGERWLVGLTLLDLTWVALAQADAASALAWSTEALAIFQELGIRRAAATALEGLGHAHRVAGEAYAAAKRYAESLTDQHREARLYPLAGLAWAALWLGRPAQAVRLLAAARALPPRRAGILDHHTYAAYQTDIATTRSALGEEAFAAAWAEGEALSLDQAVTEALTFAEEIATLPAEPMDVAPPRREKA